MTEDEAVKLITENQAAARSDFEIAHEEADKVIIRFLRAAGHDKLADAFDNLTKWYG